MKRQSSILVVTIWVLFILSVFLLSLSHIARSQLGYAGHLQDRVKLYYLARSGIEKAAGELINREELGYTAFNQSFLNDKDLFKNISLGEGFITLRYEVDKGSSQEKKTFYGAEDESSRIDINNVSVEVLSVLLERIAGLDSAEAVDLAENIVSWRSAGESPELKEYYEQLDPPYENKGSDFEVVEELLLVKGMSKEIFSKIKNIITVYGTERVNINTAGLDVLYALGLNRRLGERIVEHRRGLDGVLGTESDNLFESPSDLRNIGFLFTQDSIQINNLISKGLIKTDSDTFRIKSFGFLDEDNQENSRSITSVLRFRPEQKPEVLYWYEN